MENVLHIPLDFESLMEFRQLRAAVGPCNATFFVARLFVGLGYQARSGAAVGLLDARAATMVEEEMRGGLPNPRGPLEELKSSGFLKQREDGFFCEVFAQHNEHLHKDFVPFQVRGARAMHFATDLKKFGKRAMQISLMIPPEVWTTADGERMTSDDISSIMMLIRGCDNALGMAERTQDGNGFTQTLVRNAYEAMADFTAEQLVEIMRKILRARQEKHPAVPRTTEELLAPVGEGKSRFAQLASLKEKG